MCIIDGDMTREQQLAEIEKDIELSEIRSKILLRKLNTSDLSFSEIIDLKYTISIHEKLIKDGLEKFRLIANTIE
jgi:hypothetical protein